MKNKDGIKVECLNRETLERAFSLACRQLHKVVNATSEQVSLRAIRQDMMNKAVHQMEENQRSLPAGRRNRHELGLKGIKEITSDDYIVEIKENGWIPVEERMPEEHDSVFAKYKGTIKWIPVMFEKCSDEVEVTFKFTNNAAEEKRIVRTSHTNDGEWSIEKGLGFFDGKVVAWRPLGEPYQGEEK